MAHFAKVENGKVSQVIAVSNETLNDLEFPESEAIGKAFIASIGLDGEWFQTSKSASFRNKYAAAGDIWDGTDFQPIVTDPEE